MFKKMAIVVAVVIVAFLGFVATRPDSYRVERSIEINAPQAEVFAIVSDFSRFDAYSPWAAMDTTMKVTVTGEPGQVGQTYEWSGNDQVGSGKMANTKVDAPNSVEQSLAFLTPFESTAVAGYQLEPAGEGTKVTWWMEAQNDYMGKLFGMFMDMEGMIGSDYVRGLKKLKAVAEKDAAARAEAEAEAAAETAPAGDAGPVAEGADGGVTE